MLPPGHIAGGYLAGKLVTLAIPQFNQPEYLALSAFFGFFPDLDFFLAFAKAKKFIQVEEIDHHDFPSHAPSVYIFAFIMWFAIFPGTRMIAIAFVVGTLSHLVIDTFASSGTMWLYPLSKKVYQIKVDEPIKLIKGKFWGHWIDFIKKYSKVNAFKLEILFIFLAIIILIFNK